MYNLHGTDCCFWGAFASALPGVGNVIGQQMANRQNRQESQRDRQFQGDQAARSMRFSERMRNTSWQAGVADMEAAGLNPALAYSQGGASSPMGAAGSGSRAQAGNIASEGISSALQSKRLNADIDLIKAQVNKTNKEAAVVEGRPGRALAPIVDVVEDIVSKVMTPGYVTGQAISSARGVENFRRKGGAAVQRIIDRGLARLRGQEQMAPTIGELIFRRRRK